MSTRCLVGIKDGEEFKYIYVHHDGYISGVGKTLREHFPTVSDIEPILEYGDRSSLVEDSYPGDGDSYSERERKSKYKKPNLATINNETEIWELANEFWAEYVYILENGEWRAIDIFKTAQIEESQMKIHAENEETAMKVATKINKVIGIDGWGTFKIYVMTDEVKIEPGNQGAILATFPLEIVGTEGFGFDNKLAKSMPRMVALSEDMSEFDDQYLKILITYHKADRIEKTLFSSDTIFIKKPGTKFKDFDMLATSEGEMPYSETNLKKLLYEK